MFPCPTQNHPNAATCPPPTQVALVTGITGQDGSYLAELLIAKVRTPSDAS